MAVNFIRSPDSSSAGPVIRVEKLTKRFGNKVALWDVSFEVNRGEVLGFLGPNGAGKTTTMRILTGYFSATSGKVLVQGRELSKSPERYKRQIGYLPENVSLYPEMRVAEILDFVARLRDVPWRFRKKEVEEKIQLCGLGNVRNSLAGTLSKGYVQRVGLAQALMGNPAVLILDEPTSGLDPKQIIEIRSLIRELGRDRTIILSTHILPEVSMICNRVLIVNQGNVVASGTPDELENRVSDELEIFVTIGDIAKKETASQLLAGLTGITGLEVLELQHGASFRFRTKRTQDLRPEISRMFVEQGIPILEIRSAHLTLEDIFMKLVVREPGASSEKIG